MSPQERCDLVLAFARTLFVNGQATEQTVSASERLGRALGLHAKVMPRWGELLLQLDNKDSNLVSQVAADPTGVDMDRVAGTMRLIEGIEDGRLAPESAAKAIAAIAKAPPAPTWLFTLAAGLGAAALAVIFGVAHLPAVALIFISAAAGAMVRRAWALWSANVF